MNFKSYENMRFIRSKNSINLFAEHSIQLIGHLNWAKTKKEIIRKEY